MIYMEGSHVIISKKKKIFLSLKTVFVLANSVDSNEVPHYAAFHLVFTVCQSTHLGVTNI